MDLADLSSCYILNVHIIFLSFPFVLVPALHISVAFQETFSIVNLVMNVRHTVFICSSDGVTTSIIPYPPSIIAAEVINNPEYLLIDISQARIHTFPVESFPDINR